MDDSLCELRFDVPLPHDGGLRHFERSWRDVLAAQKLTRLAAPPAQAVSARFRVCGPALTAGSLPDWDRYLTARLGALPGSPAVASDCPQSQPDCPQPDWHGVRIWLSFRAADLTALLQQGKRKSKSPFCRGRRP